jgi:hypothetical protein
MGKGGEYFHRLFLFVHFSQLCPSNFMYAVSQFKDGRVCGVWKR